MDSDSPKSPNRFVFACLSLKFHPRFPPSTSKAPPPLSNSPLLRSLPMGADRISAVILDLDGTLLDTERATGGILEEFLARHGKSLDAAMEEKRLGKMHKESAAAIVQDYGLPMTPEEFSEAIMPLFQERWPQAKALPGVNRLIKHLHNHETPVALASNSIRKHIEIKISYQQGWKESFSVILGGDDVSHGKPSPDIFLEAAKRLGVDISKCLVIEDSLVGVRGAKDAGAKVVAVPSLQGQDENYSIANCLLHTLLEFQPELWGLPAFEDDTGLYEFIPHQVWGVFIGWANIEMHGIYKVVVCIGWDTSSGAAKRVILPYLIDHTESHKNERLHLFIVGYVRKLQNEGTMSEALRVFEEDVNIARAALDIPVFSLPTSSSLFVEAAFD
ncbi:hypothetical protein C4D60_Mb04t10180 [Musa balbisiana]|uniref:riboflavin kinase n=1 Tax=Musa balbisiana TaxID=52838 RepID=A0A4S8KAY6_MUSBA|nr:hypothetical protein C4D60_Mb04t10180 [Musa balbisiana]